MDGSALAKDDFFGSAAGIKRFLVPDFHFFTINGDDAVPPDIDHAQLTAVEKMTRLERVDGFERSCLLDRNTTSDDQPVVEGINQIDLIVFHDPLNQKFFPDPFGVVMPRIFRMIGIPYFIID